MSWMCSFFIAVSLSLSWVAQAETVAELRSKVEMAMGWDVIFDAVAQLVDLQSEEANSALVELYLGERRLEILGALSNKATAKKGEAKERVADLFIRVIYDERFKSEPLGAIFEGLLGLRSVAGLPVLIAELRNRLKAPEIHTAILDNSNHSQSIEVASRIGNLVQFYSAHEPQVKTFLLEMLDHPNEHVASAAAEDLHKAKLLTTEAFLKLFTERLEYHVVPLVLARLVSRFSATERKTIRDKIAELLKSGNPKLITNALFFFHDPLNFDFEALSQLEAILNTPHLAEVHDFAGRARERIQKYFSNASTYKDIQESLRVLKANKETDPIQLDWYSRVARDFESFQALNTCEELTKNKGNE